MTCYEIRDDNLYVRLKGIVDMPRLRGLFREIAADPRFRCELVQYWIIGNADITRLQAYLVADLPIELDHEVIRACPIVALVAAEDESFGLCRAYAAWMSYTNLPIGVFRELGDARRWVTGVADEPTPICRIA